jgi:hypothetical protein
MFRILMCLTCMATQPREGFKSGERCPNCQESNLEECMLVTVAHIIEDGPLTVRAVPSKDLVSVETHGKLELLKEV